MIAALLQETSSAFRLAASPVASWKRFAGALAAASAAMLVCLSGAASQIVSRLPDSSFITNIAGGDSYDPILSPDGRYVVFTSSSPNLLPGPAGLGVPQSTPPHLNVYWRDRQTGATSLVSVNTSGFGGNGDSFPSAISTNGQFVLFDSAASDLVPGDSNGTNDVFLRDVLHNTTSLVSIALNGGFGNGPSGEATMTPDAHFVAFQSAASNLVPGDTNGIPDIFVRDLTAGSTVLASPNAVSAQIFTDVGSATPWLSDDGRYVAFFSYATNLVPKVNFTGGVYLRDLEAGTTAWASAAGFASNNLTLPLTFAMTPDGQWIAYQTEYAGYLQPGVPKLQPGEVFLYSTASGLSQIIAINDPAVSDGDLEGRQLDISADGRFVAYTMTNAVSGSSIELWDAVTGDSALVSSGATNADCLYPRLDRTGRYVAFLSNDSTLTTNSDANQHVFVRDTSNGDIQLADVLPGGARPISTVSTPFSFAAGGTALAFACSDGSLSMNPYNYAVFVRDLAGNRTELTSSAAAGLPSLTPFAESSITAWCVSSNGQFVVCQSDYDSTGAGASNGYPNIYVHDLVSNTVSLVSVSSNGITVGSSSSFDAAISPDGRYVAFTSNATNLVPNDTNNLPDIFLRDLRNNVTTLVTVDAAGTGEANADSYTPQVSAGGRFVFFWSGANNLVSPATQWGTIFAYVRDMQAGVTYCLPASENKPYETFAAMTPDGASVLYAENQGDGPLYLWNSQDHVASKVGVIGNNAPFGGVISANGSRAVAEVYAGLTTESIYAIDLTSNTISAIGAMHPTSHGFAQFSADGRYLTLLQGSSGVSNQVVLYDFGTGSNLLVSQAFDGSGPGNSWCDSPTISEDGRYIAYRSASSNLVPGDNNNVPDIFLYDRVTGGTTLVSVSQQGPFSASARSLSPLFSANGQTLVFQSWASDLAAGDNNANDDIFALVFNGTGGVTNSAPELSVSGISAPAAGGSAPTNQSFSLTWPAAPGTAYRVQYKNSLTDPLWQNLPNPATVVGKQGQAIDAAPDPAHRFYRVLSF